MEKIGAPLDFLCKLVFPDKDIGSKVRPGSLKLTRIIQHSKWKITTILGQNVLSGEEKGAFNPPYGYGGIGEFQAMSGDIIQYLHKPNGYLWEMASVQFAAKSLEWIQRAILKYGRIQP